MTLPVAAPPVGFTPALVAAARALGASGGGAGAARLLGQLYDPDLAVERVLSCLNSEPALAARVLKVANSPYYRLSGSVGTVDRAVQMLGLSAIRGIAAAGCLDRLTPTRAGTAFEPEAFRRHSLAAACAAQHLARACGAGLEGEAFMAGLLHDIGLLLLVKADAEAMASFQPPACDSSASALAAERAHFGTTHEDCASLLVRAWSLPGWLQVGLCDHHANRPLPAERPLRGVQSLPALLALADHCAHRAGYPLWPVCGSEPLPELGEALGLSAAQIDAVVVGLPEIVSRLAP